MKKEIKNYFRKSNMKNILKCLLVVLLLGIFAAPNLKAEEGDFFFAPEIGWSHFSSSAIKEGVFGGAHFGYDTSDNLTVELLLFYGDNNGKGTNPDLRYVTGGGGIAYKYPYKRIKPSLFAGAEVTGLKFSGTGSNYKGGLYLGGAFEFYLNKVISIGFSYKYLPLFKSSDLSLLGFRLGFEL
jgi:hypothetical protein